jgi:hypothetical protein
MNVKSTSILCSVLLLLAACVVATAQNRERFGISAKAGGVNAVSGQVMVKRAGQAPQLLTSQDDLASGDVVNTAAGSQAEILLNPGTYFRLAEKSEFELVDNSLDNLLVKLNKGSAIIEATGPGDFELHIPIITEQKRMTIVRAGIYRINVTPGSTELFVRKGRISLGPNKDDVIKSGKKVTFGNAGQSIAKLVKTDADEFDDWSQTRGQTLARANTKLSARVLNGYLSSWSAFGHSGTWGLWTWSPFASCYTFLPYFGGWGSPYGRDYGLFAYYPSYYYPGARYPNNGPTIVTNNNSSSGSSSSGPTLGTSGPGSGSSSGGFGNSSSGSTGTAPVSRPGSQAGPRDPDSGSRSINRIKDPN